MRFWTIATRSFMTAMATPLIVEPTKKHTASMIILHGLGDTAYGWIDVAEQISSLMPHVKFILPTASTKPVTLNAGMKMPSWYDIKGLGAGRSAETCDGIEDSDSIVKKLIDTEVANGIPHNRIVLSGFSQGGAMSLWVGLQLPHTLAGVISMSGYLPRPTEFKTTSESNLTPTLFCHGTADEVVNLSWGQLSETAVKAAGVKNVSFKTYPRMGHSACEKEIDDILNFLKSVL